MYGMEFETERMRVRRITQADYDLMFEVYSDPHLMRFVGDGSPITAEDCSRWIGITHRNYEIRGYGLFLVESRDGEHLGFVGVTHPGGQPEPEIKYVLRQEAWGKGLAQELVAATCAHACQAWRLESIIATVHPDNAVSSRVLAKCGFVQLADRLDEDGTASCVWEFRSDGQAFGGLHDAHAV